MAAMQDLLHLKVGVEDMIQLPNLTEALLHDNLQERYQSDLIYVCFSQHF